MSTTPTLPTETRPGPKTRLNTRPGHTTRLRTAVTTRPGHTTRLRMITGLLLLGSLSISNGAQAGSAAQFNKLHCLDILELSGETFPDVYIIKNGKHGTMFKAIRMSRLLDETYSWQKRAGKIKNFAYSPTDTRVARFKKIGKVSVGRCVWLGNGMGETGCRYIKANETFCTGPGKGVEMNHMFFQDAVKGCGCNSPDPCTAVHTHCKTCGGEGYHLLESRRRRLGWKPSHDIPRRHDFLHPTIGRLIHETEQES